MNVKKVIGFDDYKILITFCNDEEKIFDMTKYWLWEKGDFITLHNPEAFKKVTPCFDTIQWENGLEIAPEELYNKSVSYLRRQSI